MTQRQAELLAQWGNFTAEREAERHRQMNPPGVEDKKLELEKLTQELATLKGRIGLLKAEITVAKGAQPYNKALFDVQWARKKSDLRAELEAGFEDELRAGKSIPAIMVEYDMNNPVFLYKIKDKLKHRQEQEAQALAKLQWSYSDFTGTQRYALARNEDGIWQYAKMKGAIGSDYEGEEAVWDIKTGDFISGDREMFDAVTPAERAKRVDMLAEVLAGTYAGAWKTSDNPYFGE